MMVMMKWDPQWPQVHVAASEYWRTFHLDSLFIVIFDHSELLPQSSGKRGGLVLTSYHLYVGVGGRGEEGGGAGNKRSSQDYQDCREEPDNSHLVRQSFQLFCVWGRRHLSQDQFPAIHYGLSWETCVLLLNNFHLFQARQPFREAHLKAQTTTVRFHFEALLKIAEKLHTFFTMALFLCPILYCPKPSPYMWPVGSRTTRPKTTRPTDNSPHQNSPQDISPQGQLAPWTTRPMDNSPHGQLTPWTTRSMDNSPHGQLAPWQLAPRTTRPMDNSPHDNSPQYLWQKLKVYTILLY